jgi:hypothetical protein
MLPSGEQLANFGIIEEGSSTSSDTSSTVGNNDTWQKFQSRERLNKQRVTFSWLLVFKHELQTHLFLFVF